MDPIVRVKKQKTPLDGFFEHGLVIENKNPSQWQGICPFCDKNKFYLNPQTKLWDCKICGIKGNFDNYLTRITEVYKQNLKGDTLLRLATNRGLKPQSFKAWNIGYSIVDRRYMIPMSGNANRLVKDIHRYSIGRAAIGTSTAHLQFMVPATLHDSERVWICEGEWDAIAWWELLRSLGVQDDVYAAPGANAFPKDLIGLFQSKEVIFLYDFDKPGRHGSKRSGRLLSGTAKSVRYLHWPDGLPDGFDIRDLICTPKPETQQTREFLGVDNDREKVFKFVTDRLKPNPQFKETDGEDETDDEKPEEEITGVGITPTECLRRYRDWLHLPNPEVLDVLFGSCFANRINVDPLWLFIVAPPGGSKSELLMSLSNAPKMTATTTMTSHALISGANFSGKDPSLIPKLNGKTLIVKDFTTILSMNDTARDEIFSILRDVYDGHISKNFGNGVTRTYESRFGIVAGVTPVIETFSASGSVLGERFIKYFIKQKGHINVGKEVIERAVSNISKESNMRKELKKIAVDVLKRSTPEIPKIPPEIAEKLVLLAQITASLRGVVSRNRFDSTVTAKPCAEVGTRLAKQFGVLAIGISIYKHESEVSQDTMKTILAVAKDTCPGRVEEVVKQVYIHDALDDSSEGGYFSTAAISQWTRFPVNTISLMLQDLELLYIVKRKEGKVGYWKLSPAVSRIINQIGLYDEEKQHAKEIRKLRQPMRPLL